MLQADRLTKYYAGISAIRDVSFSVQPGQVLGYLGPNGSGKSTTVKLLTGLLEPTSGRVIYQGQPIQDNLIEFRRVLGFVPEEAHVYSYLTGPEFLALIGRLRNIAERVLQQRIADLLEIWGLTDARYTTLASYSKGMRQKILISAALLHNPRILILDEPDAGLDVTALLVLRAVVARLAAQSRIVLYSSHVLSTVESICSDVVILHEGQVVAHDTVGRLRDLMSLPSLEDVFRKLAVHTDVEGTADRLIGAISQ
ncbi:MAG: ABC transporter ATP-binding protein [Vicinamibacterales bacterium]